MGKILAIILALVLTWTLFSLPFYLLGNFLLWVFHATFRLTFLQAFALSLVAITLRIIFCGDKGGK